MTFSVIIPARYASSRFPGKPLADLAGKPMVVRVCERAAKSGADAVHVATDDERIASAVKAHGFPVVMTRADHASGTDRLSEAAAVLKLDEKHIVVNVQGDEPLIEPALIRKVAQALGPADVHRVPRDPRRGLAQQSERGEGRDGCDRPRPVFLALAHSVPARRRRGGRGGLL